MTVDEFLALLQLELPLSEALEGDRVGVQVEPTGCSISHVLTCLEVTDAVLDEAKERGCDCIVTFHPLIYTPLQELRASDRVARCVMRAVELRCAVISVHTALDVHPEGTNAVLAERLGIRKEATLVPSRTREGFGLGVVGTLLHPMTVTDFAHFVAEQLGTTVRYCCGRREAIERVALVAGSGTAFLEHAIAAGVDAFVTADVKYHTFHAAAGRIALIDPGHFEMEQHVPELLARLIGNVVRAQNAPVRVVASSTRTTPVMTEIPLIIETEGTTTITEL